jgi:hypothetical protein
MALQADAISPYPDGQHCHADGVHEVIRSSDLVDDAAIVADLYLSL